MSVLRHVKVIYPGGLCGFSAPIPIAAEEGYGSVAGQFVLRISPTQQLLVKKGDANAQGLAAICAAQDIPVMNCWSTKTKGIANVFFYLPKAPANVHPS